MGYSGGRFAIACALLASALGVRADGTRAEWNFARTADVSSWKVSCETVRQDSDGLYLAGDGKTSLEFVFPRPLQAGDYKSAELDFTSAEGDGSVVMRFRGADEAYAGPRSVRFPTLRGESRLVRRADLVKTAWKGEIAAIRLSPIGSPRGWVKLHGLRLLRSPIPTEDADGFASEAIRNGSFEDVVPGFPAKPDGWEAEGRMRFVPCPQGGRQSLEISDGRISQLAELRVPNGTFDFSFHYHLASGAPAQLELEYVDIFGKPLASPDPVALNGTGKWQVWSRRFRPDPQVAAVRVSFATRSALTLDLVSLVPHHRLGAEYRESASHWIWSGEGRLTAGKPVYFRRAFDVSDVAAITVARLHLMTRDPYFHQPFGAKVYLNGREVPQEPGVAYWEWERLYDLTPHLRAGRNVIGIESNQRYATAGIHPELFFETRSHDGSRTQRRTGVEDWMSAESAIKDWTVSATVSTNAFVPVHVWKDRDPGYFCRVSYRYPGTAGRLSVAELPLPSVVDAGRDQSLELSVEIARDALVGDADAILADAQLRPVTVSEDGKLLTRMGRIACKAGDRTVRLPLDFRFHPSGAYSFRLYADRLSFEKPPRGFTYNRVGNYIEKRIVVRGRAGCKFPETRLSGVREGNPRLFIDGQERSIHRFSSAEFTQNVTEDAMAFADDIAACDDGVLGLQLDGVYYVSPGVWDFSHLDSQLTSLLSRQPGRKLILQFMMDCRGSRGNLGDWVWENEKDWARDFNGSTDLGQYGTQKNNPLVSTAAESWRKTVPDQLRQLVRHLAASPLADGIVGIAPSLHCEWFMTRGLSPQYTDYSEPFQKAFRLWTRQRYGTIERVNAAWAKSYASFDEIRIPSKKERVDYRYVDYIERPKHGIVIDYHDFINRHMTEYIEQFCGIVKKESDRRLLSGVYYGYSTWVCGPNQAATSGHSGLADVIDCPDVDFFMQPPRYVDRGAGGASGLQGTVGTPRLHGKLVVNEADNRLLHSWDPTGRTPSLFDSAAVIEREFGFTLATGGGMAWLQFGEDWLTCDPRLRHVYRACDAVEKTLSARGGARVDEANSLAVVYDEKASTLVPGDALTLMQLREFYPHTLRVGCGVQWYLLSDLEKLGGYRCIVFASSVLQLTDRQRQFVEKTLKGGNRTLVFLNAAGLFKDDRIVPSGVGELAGMRIAGKGIGVDYPFREFRSLVRTATDDPILKYVEPQSRFVFPTQQGPWFHADDPSCSTLYAVEKANVPGVVVKRYPTWTAVHCAAGAMPAQLLRGLAEDAGIRIFNVRQGDVTYAARDFACVYTASAGVRRFATGRRTGVARELLTGRDYPIVDGHFCVEMSAGSCGYFFVK